MKKRIGSKLYDTDNGILILKDAAPGQSLYKQPNKRTFYLFGGETISPLTFDEAAEIIRGVGDPDLVHFLEVKTSDRGCISIGSVTADRYHKLERIARARGVSMKSIIESFIDSLPEE